MVASEAGDGNGAEDRGGNGGFIVVPDFFFFNVFIIFIFGCVWSSLLRAGFL